MGRCRAASRLAEDDPNHNQRSKKKRVALNAENSETLPTGQRITDSKVSLYHCNYCNKDISGKIRIKCVVCQDFDLCIECFSVGAEVTPHKSNHPYRIMDNLSFPLICPDWNADEEMLLLEGLEMYGFGNWNEVAEYVGTKSKFQCIEHYKAVYMSSPCFPLPDLSHVMGKSREELLAMTKGHEVNKGFFLNELNHNVWRFCMQYLISLFHSMNLNTYYEESRKEEITALTMPRLTSACGKAYSSTIKKASNVSQNNDGVKVEVESQADRSIGEKKPKLSGEDRPSMTDLSGYSFKREEFEIEYDNDAEQVLADMEFKDTDTDTEHEMKLHVLHIYSKRLDERKRRKNFILERDLLYPDPFEKSLLPEELQICQHYKVFMRFHSKEEHQDLLKNIIEEHKLVKRIEDLQCIKSNMVQIGQKNALRSVPLTSKVDITKASLRANIFAITSKLEKELKELQELGEIRKHYGQIKGIEAKMEFLGSRTGMVEKSQPTTRIRNNVIMTMSFGLEVKVILPLRRTLAKDERLKWGKLDA
ncbi:hypothetical protein VNO77_42744 [Canavalia gladiata]|uniref:Transcriptional adapter n=1 Tax=Canavalia gladiata TaxID=3824 RepID=A0AAN9JTH3_CANGL